MLSHANRRFGAFALLAASVLGLIVVASPLRAAAADILGRTFDYGVFVNKTRVQVLSVPITVDTSQSIHIQGWVLEPHTMKPGFSLIYSLDGGVPKPVSGYPLVRPDVAKALHDPDAGRSGFELPVNVKALSAGLHRFHFTLIGPSAAMTVLPTDVQLMVQQK